MRGLFAKLAGQKGVALPIVLALLAVGSLTMVPLMNYAQSTLNQNRVIEKNTEGTYAADAGVEYALWALKYGYPVPTALGENINGMSVSIATEDKGPCILYLGELVEPDGHNEYLRISSNIGWDASANFYKYTITVKWQPDSGTPVIHLSEIGARLPSDYTYVPGSANSFDNNLSRSEPNQIFDSLGVQIVNWVFGTPEPSVSQTNQTRTQSFYMAGPSEQEGNYAWIVANREDIGLVGEISGNLVRIVATATNPSSGAVTGQITCDVLVSDSIQYILLWQTRDED